MSASLKPSSTSYSREGTEQDSCSAVPLQLKFLILKVAVCFSHIKIHNVITHLSPMFLVKIFGKTLSRHPLRVLYLMLHLKTWFKSYALLQSCSSGILHCENVAGKHHRICQRLKRLVLYWRHVPRLVITKRIIRGAFKNTNKTTTRRRCVFWRITTDATFKSKRMQLLTAP